MINGRQRLKVFLEFLVFAFVLGVIEDIIAVLWATGEPFSWRILVIVAIVTIPFAAAGEFIIDRTKLLPDRVKKRRYDYFEIFFKFFIFGFIMGVTEDLLAVVLATGHPITWHVIGICALVALPFAFLGEIVLDVVRPAVRSRVIKQAEARAARKAKKAKEARRVGKVAKRAKLASGTKAAKAKKAKK